MILRNYLSHKGQYIDEKIDLSAGTLAWNLRAKKRSRELEDFIDATIGSGCNNDGSLLTMPTLVEEFKKLTGDQLFSYSNLRGMSDFVHAWKKDTLNTFPKNLIEKTDQYSTLPITSIGITGGLSIVGEAFFNPGEALLVPNSRWGNVDNVFLKNQQLRGINYNLLDENGNLNFHDLTTQIKRASIEENKLGIYLNFPNNPSGISPTFEQLKLLQDTISELSKPTIIILDDAYEGFVYEDSVIDYSLFPHLIGLNENVIVAKVDGASKRFCAYGARLGLVTVGFGSEAEDQEKFQVRELLAKIARSTTSSPPRGIQEALLNVFTDEKKYEQIEKEKKHVYEVLKNRYQRIKKLSEEIESKILLPAKFNSGFFSYYLIKTQQSANEIASKLMERGLGIVPFINKENGLNGIRVAYCSIADYDITRAMDILYSIF
jgi:aspartate/methionine/tyrosine aminotransferase